MNHTETDTSATQCCFVCSQWWFADAHVCRHENPGSTFCLFGAFHLTGQKKKKKKTLKLLKFENKEKVICPHWHKETLAAIAHPLWFVAYTKRRTQLEHLSVVSCPCFQIIRKTQRRLKWRETDCSAKSPSQRALYTLPGCNKKNLKNYKAFLSAKSGGRQLL